MCSLIIDARRLQAGGVRLPLQSESFKLKRDEPTALLFFYHTATFLKKLLCFYDAFWFLFFPLGEHERPLNNLTRRWQRSQRPLSSRWDRKSRIVVVAMNGAAVCGFNSKWWDYVVEFKQSFLFYLNTHNIILNICDLFIGSFQWA